MVKLGGRGYELVLSLDFLRLLELLSRLDDLLLLVLLELWTGNLSESEFASPDLEKEKSAETVGGALIGHPSCLVVAPDFLLNDPELVQLLLVLKQFSHLIDHLHNLVIQAARRTASSWTNGKLGS